ncbi:MAG: 2'-5' RNA ligase family protein [Spirochaetales bacterium]|nr:2'-5' RNA ligase family protein [Spirochaetales bacterium]
MGFAFEMFFDSKSEEKITSIWEKLIARNLPSFMLENNCKPHISLSVYNNLGIETAKKNLFKFCSEHNCFNLFLGFIGTFVSNENVIFIAPSMTENLINIHKDFHAKFSYLQDSGWDYYLPNKWQPHCTMAIEISKEQYINSFNTIRENFNPIEITVEAIGLVGFRPIKLIQEYKLK